MSVHLTEEEQIAVLKRWWKDNGKMVVIATLASIASYFAWTGWQDKQRTKAEDASVRYESLLKLVTVEAGKTLTAENRTTAEHIAGELKDKNAHTMYAYSAAFFLAKLAVDSGELDKAVKELEWVLAAKPDTATAQLAHVRLARVLVSKAAYTEALAQIADEPSKAFSAEYTEVRGDILNAQGNKAAALTAYEKAIADTDSQQQQRLMVLKMKAENLKLPTAPVEEKAQ